MFWRDRTALWTVIKVLVDGGYTGDNFARGRQNRPGRDSRNRQAIRTAHVRRDPETVGGRVLVRLAG